MRMRNEPTPWRPSARALLQLLLATTALTGMSPARAQDATWLAGPASALISDAANWSGFASPMGTIGLKIEPNFHLRNTSGIQYLWNGPLFTPYNGTGGDAPYAGFRWKVLSWRELS